MKLFEFDTDDAFSYENGYYLTSHPTRIGKLLAHYELYKRIVDLPGHIVECGVFKGASLLRFATFRELMESPFSRKIIGFDAFGKFPPQDEAEDAAFIEEFESQAGEGISIEELEKVLHFKRYQNIELVRGDVTETVPQYVEDHPELKIALLHVDVDVYKPTQTILQHLFSRVVAGGIVAFDDFATVAGETQAIDEFFADRPVRFQKLRISHIPSFLVKEPLEYTLIPGL